MEAIPRSSCVNHREHNQLTSAVAPFHRMRPLDHTHGSIKRWIWIYFWLLILEGALRKWVLPQASRELLLVRDPVALLIYWKAYKWGRVPASKLVPFAILSLGLISLAVLQIVAGVNTPVIAAYGLRCYLLHIPLVYTMAAVLDARDVRQFGRWFLIISIPMALLVFVQYKAAPDSWLNAGIRGDFAQLDFANGHVRASGTFSFVTGTTSFLAFVSAFLVYAVSRSKVYSHWIVWPSAILTLAALPAVGSRTALFCVIGILLSALISAGADVKMFVRFLKPIAFTCVAGVGLMLTPFFQDAIATFQDRWTEAANQEGGIKGSLNSRVLHTVGEAFDPDDNTFSPIGHGIGLGSNVASVLQSGSSGFLLAEGEWARVVLEFGPLFGFAFMSLRVLFCANSALKSYRAIRRSSPLSWLLLAAVAPIILLQIMEQPTSLGFMVFGSGLCLAALSERRSRAHPSEASSRTAALSMPAYTCNSTAIQCFLNERDKSCANPADC